MKIASAKIDKICWEITVAALMHPLQYDLRCPAAKENSITYAAAAPSNLDAAITMHFAASRRKPAPTYAHGNRAWQQSCSHSTAICNHRFKKRIELHTQEQPLVAEHRGRTNFVANPHVSTHMAIKHNNNHVAIPLRSATADSKTPYHYARASTPKAAWRHRSSAAKKRQTDRSRNRRTQEVPFIAGWSHFTWKNIRFRAPASSPSQAPCNIHAAITTSLSVLLCDAKFHTTVSHRPSLSVLLCDAKSHTTQSHTTLSWVNCYVMSRLTPQSHTTLHWVYSYVM